MISSWLSTNSFFESGYIKCTPSELPACPYYVLQNRTGFKNFMSGRLLIF
jgi:hypothetical protein